MEQTKLNSGLVVPKLPSHIYDVDRGFLEDPRSKRAFIGSSAVRRATAPYVGHPEAIFMDHTGRGAPTAILSTDKKFRKDMNVAEKELSAAHVPESDNGFSTNGYVSDFTAMNSVSGIKALPGNAPTMFADELIKDKGLAESFATPRHKRIFNLIWDCMFSRLEENSASISRISSSTIPFFTSAVPRKQRALERLLNNLDDVLTLVAKDDFRELQRRYGVAIAYVLGERHQPDGGSWSSDGSTFTGKPRYASTRGSAFQHGDPILVDKHSFLKEHYGLENCAAMRVRTVYGLAGFITYLMSCLLVMARKVYFREYAFTWKHTTREQIFDKVKDLDWITGLDVTQMDQHVPSWFLDAYADRWKGHVDPRLAKVFNLINTAPYFCPQLEPGSKPFWVGNPYHIDGFWARPGLASGRPDVPDLGKLWMTFVYVCMIDDITKDVLEQKRSELESIQHFLKGHYKIKLLDMGDDAVIGGGPETHAFDKQLKVRMASKTATPYALLDVEKVVAFLGNVFRKDKLTGEVIMPEPNPTTLIVNRIAREHGVQNQAHSQFWGAGLLLALEHYGQSSAAVEAWRHFEEIWRTLRPGEPTPTMMAKAHAKIKPVGGVAGVSDADIQVLLDPSKLHYKFTPDMLSPNIRDKFTTEVPSDKIRKAFRSFATIH